MARQIGSAVQEIDYDDLLGIFDEHDKMLSGARKAQIFIKIRIDDPAAILRLRHTRRDVPADGNQVFFVGSSLPGAKSLDRPNRDIDEGAFRRSCEAPGFWHFGLGSGPIAGKSKGASHGVLTTAVGKFPSASLLKANRQPRAQVSEFGFFAFQKA